MREKALFAIQLTKCSYSPSAQNKLPRCFLSLPKALSKLAGILISENLPYLSFSQHNPRSMQKPRPSSCHLYAGGRLGSKQVSPKLVQNQTQELSFDLVFTVSTPHQWFAGTHLLGPHLPRSFAVTFPQRSPPWLLTTAA